MSPLGQTALQHPLRRMQCELFQVRTPERTYLLIFRVELSPFLREKENLLWQFKPATFQLAVECFNPLTTEFFPPRQHIFMHSAHTTFVGAPLPQHSLLSGQTWWGPHAWRDPSGNTVNDIHDPPQGQQSEVKGGCQPDFRPAFP